MKKIIFEMTLLCRAPTVRTPVKNRIISQEEIDAGKYLIYIGGAVCWFVLMLILFKFLKLI